MTMPLLQTSRLDSLPVIIFRNHSLGVYEVMICEDKETCQEEVIRLRTMEHIEIYSVEDAVVKRAV
jgi:hypothetical protein